MELNHWSHDHTLILSEELYSEHYECEACRGAAGGLCYCCTECPYVLHKWCADLPREIPEHELHPQHPLILIFQKHVPRQEPSSAFCGQCSRKIFGFAFCCAECLYNLHTHCASLPKELKIDLQQADFDLYLPDQGSLRLMGNICCYLCSMSIFDSMFIASDDVKFHIQCAMLPKSLKHPRHLHSLDLAHRITDPDPSCEEFYCDNCEQERDAKGNGAYYCKQCSYVSHISCGIAGLVRPPRDILRSNLKYVEVVKAEVAEREFEDRYSLKKSILEKEKERDYERRIERVSQGKQRPQLEHFSHEDHPLVLYDELMNRSSQCIACGTAIYGKTYICNECPHYLHKWCAQLPQQITLHPLHPEHPLILFPNFDFECNFCRNGYSKAFTFRCKVCDFDLDVLCASLPQNLKHQGHEHPLAAVMLTHDYRTILNSRICHGNLPVRFSELPACRACGFPCNGLSLECADCDYYLHVPCSLLPPNGKASTHMHDLNIVYSFEEDPNALEFICDACETERVPGIWVYCCPMAKCNFLAHIDCAVP